MNRKNTLFIVSSGTDADGYFNFINTAQITNLAVHGVYLTMKTWNGYFCWATFDTHENAKNSLDIIIDQMDQSKMNTPKKVLKLNELDGVLGTDGVLTSSYNSSTPWSS